jgi:hypothetical protein
MGYVAISASLSAASRGYPQRVGRVKASQDAALSWDIDLRRFCELVGYDFDQLVTEGKVGWFLCSWWSE